MTTTTSRDARSAARCWQRSAGRAAVQHYRLRTDRRRCRAAGSRRRLGRGSGEHRNRPAPTYPATRCTAGPGSAASLDKITFEGGTPTIAYLPMGTEFNYHLALYEGIKSVPGAESFLLSPYSGSDQAAQLGMLQDVDVPGRRRRHPADQLRRALAGAAGAEGGRCRQGRHHHQLRHPELPHAGRRCRRRHPAGGEQGAGAVGGRAGRRRGPRGRHPRRRAELPGHRTGRRLRATASPAPTGMSWPG